MSLSGALWHPHIGHLWPNPECPGALRMKQLSLNSKCMCFHGIAGKGFMSLKAGTRQPLSSEDWAQSKVSAVCQVTSHNTSSGPWRCSALLWIYPPSPDATAVSPRLPAAPSIPCLGGTRYRFLYTLNFLYIQVFLYVQFHNLEQHHCDSMDSQSHVVTWIQLQSTKAWLM